MRFRLAAAGILVLSFAATAGAQDVDQLVKDGHFKQARAILEPKLKANPNDAHALYLMSQVKAAFGDEATAYALAEKAVQLDGQNADYRFQYAKMIGERAENASVFKQMGLAKSFRKEVEAVLARDPRHVEGRFALMLYYQKAPGIIGGDKKKAAQIADEMVKSDPVDGWFAKARLASENKQFDQLPGFYQRAYEADPKNYAANTNLAAAYIREKKWEQAEKHARQAIAIKPGSAGGYAQLATIFVNQKKWAELNAILTEAEKKVPQNFGPYYAAGNALLATGENFPTAEQYFKKYLTQEPEARNPKHAHARWRLGLLYEKQSKKAEAKTEIAAAVRELPNFEPAKKDLARLK